MEKKIRRRPGDRKDGVLLRKVDSMHFIMPIIYPNRCDNEAFISERIDLTNLDAFLAKKNENNEGYKYNLFQAIVTAIVKTLTLRPQMNRFIMNGNTYMRNEISAAFTIKKQFRDDGDEGLAIIRAYPETTFEDIHNEMYRRITGCRGGKTGSTDDAMEILNKLPRFISKAFVRFICFLDKHGKIPSFLIEGDPYYQSVVLSNLGSIKLKAGYHHLTNWGTNSMFVVIGEKKIRPFFDDEGNVTMRNSVDLGLTVDERIADGYYFSKTVKLFKYLLENPELLELPANCEVDYDGNK